MLPPIGTFGNAGRNDLIGPDLRTTDVSFVKAIPWSRLGNAGQIQLRIEVFNLFNRPNFGVPNLIAFAGAADGEAVVGNFGRIRNTVTSARQMQLGIRFRW